jgi:trimeric autotransporter adhesin
MKNPKSQLLGLLISLVCLLSGAYAQLTPSADAYTSTAAPTTNYGAKTLLDVESASQTTYIRFDLSSIPADYGSANITKATLKLYVNSVMAAGSFNVDYVNGTWAENTITADLAPALGTTIAASVPLTVADKNQYILIDVTATVQAWLSGTTNDGIALVGNSPVNATFDSKESTSTSHTAELDIVFAGGGGGGGIAGIITANGSGLNGGGNSGTLNLSLTNTCAAKQILQWTASAWACASPGTGTVTSVGSGAGLTGGPITGSGTLSIATAGVSNSMLANPSLTISPGTALSGGGSVALGGSTTLSLDTNKVPLLAAANTFSTNQTVNGTVTASSFSGNGASLTNVTANNSNELGGLAPSAYAQLGAANTFSNNQTVNGAITAKSNNFTIGASTTSVTDPAISGFGPGLGVMGSASASSGIGVEGETTAASGIGVEGFATGTGTTYGVYGGGVSSSALGVVGSSQYIGVEGAATDIGVYGAGSGTSIEGTGSGHAGVWGDTGGAAGDFAGVLGTADNNVAGYFFNNGPTSPTLFAENYASSFGDEVFASYILYIDGSAIIGDPGCNTGFIALQLGQDGMSGCSNYTVAGGNNGHTYINATTNGAVHIRINSVDQLVATSGNVDVLGTLSKGGGSFKIDHPLDPANKYLYHSFVESPDMMNIYNGNITTDTGGEAAVELPEWFETLNRDFRYQLTVIGQFAQAIVANEVANHRFVIKTDKPNVKVSWQVTGIRQDSFANAHRIPVETEKAPADRGHYLYPELVGAPETARIGYMAPAPGSEHVVHNRPVIRKRDGAAESQRTPLHVPVLSTMPHPPAN